MVYLEAIVKNRLAELRAEANITQNDLADEVGTSRQTIISIEKGRYDPGLRLAYKLAASFGKSIEEVFDFDDEW